MAVFSLFMESYASSLNNTLRAITKLLGSYEVSFVFIRGVARNQYSSIRMTEDIDILVDSKDRKKLSEIPIGFMRDKTGNQRVFYFHSPPAIVETVFSGEKAGSSKGIPYLSPVKVVEKIEGLPFVSLYHLVRYKISSGMYASRYNDYGDVQDLIVSNSLPKEYLQSEREDIKTMYEKLWYDTTN